MVLALPSTRVFGTGCRQKPAVFFQRRNYGHLSNCMVIGIAGEKTWQETKLSLPSLTPKLLDNKELNTRAGPGKKTSFLFILFFWNALTLVKPISFFRIHDKATIKFNHIASYQWKLVLVITEHQYWLIELNHYFLCKVVLNLHTQSPDFQTPTFYRVLLNNTLFCTKTVVTPLIITPGVI